MNERNPIPECLAHLDQLAKADKPKWMSELVRKGAWSLGTACGACSRCRDSAIPLLKDFMADLKMYQHAWQRELGGKLTNKVHLIDALVLTTRQMRLRLEAYEKKERDEKNKALEDAHNGCLASWQAASRAFDIERTFL